jgi:Bacterial SH3 domain.
MKLNKHGIAAVFLGLLLSVFCACAAAEAKLTFTPETPRAGDYVDVTVTPDREGAVAVRYILETRGGTVVKSEDSTHFTASFRPREETVYTLTATLVYGKKDTESVTVTIPVSGTAPAQEGPDVVYSQKDGWWQMYYSKKHRETLQKGGCAIFSLSHLLQRRGLTGSELQPDALSVRYSRFYIAGRGTDNPGLISQTAGEYGFVTQEDLMETEREIVDCLRRGDLLSFSVVLGHIAMADGISEDGSKVHVVDSAPGATFERKDRFKTKGHIFWQAEDGSFREAVSAEDLPGIRWFFETGEYGGMSYWLDTPYCAYRGMRLVREPWLTLENTPVTPEYVGALISKVSLGEESICVPTASLVWNTSGESGSRIAVVTAKKGTNLLDGNKKPLKRYSGRLPAGTMLMVLGVEDDLCYVFWKDTFGYLSRKDVDLLSAEEGSFSTGLVSMNGKTAGTAKVTVRRNSGAKAARVTEWTIGTPVAVVKSEENYVQVEAKGLRGWIPKKYLTPDAAENTDNSDSD